MHLHDKYSREIIQFPKRINVPLIQLTKIRHLLNVGHKVDIVFQHMFNFYPIRDNCTCEVIGPLVSYSYVNYLVCIL